MQKITLVYEKGYYSIQDQDLPMIGYYFICREIEGGSHWEVRKMIDEYNAEEIALCYDRQTAYMIAEKLNEE